MTDRRMIPRNAWQLGVERLAGLIGLAGTLLFPGASFPAEPNTAEVATARDPAVTDRGSPTAADSYRGGLRPDIVVVVGAPGTAEYEADFAQWAQRWHEAAGQAEAEFVRIGPPHDSSAEERSATVVDGESDRQRLLETLQELQAESAHPLWIVLIGHGTFYQDVAKFNLVGPDISAAELAEPLDRFDRPIVVVNAASASGPFINRLSGRRRIIVTATKSGVETNFARFGDYFSAAIGSREADLDHDEEVSVLEAFLRATADVRRFYESESRLSTEHALLDDNGDGKGSPANLFDGLRPAGEVESGAEIDGKLARRMTLVPAADRLPLTEAEQAERDELERSIEQLRAEKGTFEEAEYYRQLEPLFLQLARLYRKAEQRIASGGSDDAGGEPPEKTAAEPSEPGDATDSALAEEAPASVNSDAGEGEEPTAASLPVVEEVSAEEEDSPRAEDDSPRGAADRP